MAYPSATFAIQPADFCAIGAVAFRQGALGSLPRLVMQEGGYLFDKVPASVAGFLFGGD